MASMASRTGALLFCALFAIGFGAGGYFAGLQPLGRTLLAAWQVRHWQPVPATVLQAELREQRHSEGGLTYAVHARYRYAWGPRTYEGDRVGLEAAGGADNVGDWHRQWHGRLLRAQAQGQAITVWVDPADPGNALIDPAIRWSLLIFRLPFALVFTGVGLAAGWIFLRLLLGRTTHGGGAPWPGMKPAGDQDGAASSARSSLHGSALGAWLFALFWCGIAFPMAAVIWLDGAASGWALAFISVFVVVGVLLLGFAIRQTRVVWRYRGAAFTALPQRPVGGGLVEATLLLPYRAAEDSSPPFRLRLAQYRVDESSSGSPERLVERVESRGAQPCQPTPEGGLRLIARFAVPGDAPAHGAVRSGERVAWRVELLGADGGVELSYELPVQAAPQAAAALAPGGGDRFDRRAAWKHEEPIVLPDAEGLGAREAGDAQDHGAMPWPPGAVASETPEGWQLTFSQAGWRWAAAVALALLALEWVVNGRLGSQGLVLPRSPGGLAVWALLLAFSLHAATRRWVLRVADGGLVVHCSSWLWSSQRSLSGEASPSLVHKVLYSTGSGSNERMVHAVYVRGTRGSLVRLTPGVGDADVARAVGRAIMQAWQDRRGRFAASALRAGRDDHSRPSWGWLLVAGLVAGPLWWPPHTRTGDEARWSEASGGTSPSRIWSAVDMRLMDAQDAGDAAGLEQALRDGANPNLLADSGSSVLMLAAHRGQMAHVELLLRAGAEPDLRQTRKDSERGDTALLRAFYGGHLAVAQRLVQAGASLQSRNRWDWGPVHMAAQSGCVPCLQWLAGQGLLLDEPAPASRGETPAMLAAAKGRVEVLQWLAQQGVDLRRKDPHGKTALDWARFGNQPEAERWLAEAQR